MATSAPDLLERLLGRKQTAGALLVTADGRYLLQQRDNIPTIPFPNAWGLFGGEIEAGETPIEGLMRELQEEIEFVPQHVAFFTELLFDPMIFDPGVQHRFYFEVPIDVAQVPCLVQHEGQAMRLCTAAEIYRMAADIIPFDQVAIHLHLWSRRSQPLGTPA